nr:hypothetical protein [Desulfobulbaceae bacterium]
MKIDGIKNQRIADKSSVKKSKAAGEINFFSLLEGQLHPPEPTATVQSTSFTDEPAVPAQLRLDGVFISENTIDLLESFENSLENLTLTETDLTPIIDALEHGTTSLLDIKEQLPKDDPLALLIDQVATISIIETEKFRRGDYS